ncbi:MAG: sulfite exporter TauE/SafE family protein [Oscillospiraceae bacterium]|nr:sulfite exporter TauE/SafE family protein [Oscillospiraceae bacterium]
MTVLAIIAGALTGVLTAWGVGGGSLLIIYMTAVAGLELKAAQGINLLYFIPASATGIISHVRNQLVDKHAALPAIIAGVPTATVTAILASGVEPGLLRKIFGGFLLLMGVMEFFKKPANKADSQ